MRGISALTGVVAVLEEGEGELITDVTVIKEVLSRLPTKAEVERS